MTPDGTDKPRQTVYEIGDREIVLTLDDARQMREALRSYSADHRHELREFGVEEEPGEARIDSTGSIRIGAWLLDTDDDQLVLGRRVRTTSPAGYSYRLVAQLERISGGRWTVSDIQSERILPRR
jgi:hypothetical protein